VRFSGAKVHYFWETAKLFDNFLLKVVKVGPATVAVAEEADADALPVAGTHGEGLAALDKALAIGAIGELMQVFTAVVSDA